LHHYILLCKTTVVADVNPFQYVLTRRIIGGKYNKWIIILQEFDLDFASAKSKKSLVFAELISDFPQLDEDAIHVDSFADEHVFLVSSSNPWYGDIVLYLQTLKFPLHLSRDDRQRIIYQANKYTIVGDTLYRRGIKNIFRRCLTHREVEYVLNDCHNGSCGGHLSEIATSKKKPVISGLLSLKIVLKRLRSVTPTRCSLGKCARIQPLFTQSLPSVPSPSGGCTS
jgi:hypothetical protein